MYSSGRGRWAYSKKNIGLLESATKSLLSRLSLSLSEKKIINEQHSLGPESAIR
jgi:hypothetical protein